MLIEHHSQTLQNKHYNNRNQLNMYTCTFILLTLTEACMIVLSISYKMYIMQKYDLRDTPSRHTIPEKTMLH